MAQLEVINGFLGRVLDRWNPDAGRRIRRWQMQIEIFNPNTTYPDKTLVIFPAKMEECRNGDDSKRVTDRRINTSGYNYRLVSDVYDKAVNRVHASFDLITRSRFVNGQRVVPVAGSTNPRIAIDIKLEIPRGTLSPVKEQVSELIEAPVLKYGADNQCKLRHADGSEEIITGWSSLNAMYRRLIDYLEFFYKTEGIPAACDRRKLPQLLKNYTGMHRDYVKAGNTIGIRNCSHSIATALADMLAGWRQSQVTLQDVLAWKLLPEFPKMLIQVRKGPYSQIKQTSYIGTFQSGGFNYTKNAQLANKLSIAMGTPITLQELSDAIHALTEELMARGITPQIDLSGGDSRLYILGITKTTKKGEK